MTTSNWRIRRATLGDAETLVEFNRAIAQETEGKSLPLEVVSRGVRRGLCLGDDVVYLVAEPVGGALGADGSPVDAGELHARGSDASLEARNPAPPPLVGCLMLTREWSDWRDGWLIWIQSVYVREAFRGRGVFRALLDSAIEDLRQQTDIVGVRLYVEAENHRAQAVYTKTGFSDPSYKVLEQIF